jgi:hypothetical protein
MTVEWRGCTSPDICPNQTHDSFAHHWHCFRSWLSIRIGWYKRYRSVENWYQNGNFPSGGIQNATGRLRDLLFEEMAAVKYHWPMDRNG